MVDCKKELTSNWYWILRVMLDVAENMFPNLRIVEMGYNAVRFLVHSIDITEYILEAYQHWAASFNSPYSNEWILCGQDIGNVIDALSNVLKRNNTSGFVKD